MGTLLKVLYWLAVLAISLALVVGLILWLESQDESEIQGSGLPVSVPAAATTAPSRPAGFRSPNGTEPTR